jgi:sugar-specific transcriptional regulator TrmB
MIIKSELVKRIKEYFDLNIYETKVWVALLSKGVASAGEVAEISGVPRSRTYDVLESLEKRGFAIVRIGKPVKYLAVKPTEVIEKIKSKTLVDAQEKVKTLSNLKDTAEYTELELLHKSGIAPIKHTDITGSLKGRANVISRMKDLLENSQKEAIICTSASDFEDKSRVLLSTIETLNKNAIKVRIALSGDADHVKRISNKHNIKAKHIDFSGRVFLADNKEMLFMVTPENSEEEVGVWLSSPFFTQAMHTILDQVLTKN